MAKKKKELNKQHIIEPSIVLQAISFLSKEKHIEVNTIVEAMKQAFAAAYRKNYNTSANVLVDIDLNTGILSIKPYKTVVEEVVNDEQEISLEQAKETIPNIELGENIYSEVDPTDFGRVAVATAKQVVIQRIKEAEKESILEEFGNKENELLLGQVSREDENNYYIDLGRAHGLLPKTELIGNEKIVMNSSIKVYVTKIETAGRSPLILLSRRFYGFVKKLLELEIPELANQEITLHNIAREAGLRSKIAVSSNDSNIEAVGTCIGESGNRINRIIKELNGEKIDVVLYDEDPYKFIENALSPAKVIKIVINNPEVKEAIAVVDKENFSLAIGKMGSNVRLAARLTRYKIDIKTLEDFCKEEN